MLPDIYSTSVCLTILSIHITIYLFNILLKWFFFALKIAKMEMKKQQRICCTNGK